MTTKVWVPQESGELSVSTNGDVDDPTRYRVSNHLVSCADDVAASAVLVGVAGARLDAEPKAAAADDLPGDVEQPDTAAARRRGETKA